MAGMRAKGLPSDPAPEQRAMYQMAGLGGYSLMGGDSSGGESGFAAFFARYPAEKNAHFFYGYLLFSHNPTMAIEEFRRELAVAPDNIAVRETLAYSLMVMGRFAEALPEAQRVATENPGSRMNQIVLGRALAETGDEARGVALVNEVLRLDPNNLEAHIALAAIYSRAGKMADARRERMVALELTK
jgi:tetratricopeptide (TPR) repeat protein